MLKKQIISDICIQVQKHKEVRKIQEHVFENFV